MVRCGGVKKCAKVTAQQDKMKNKLKYIKRNDNYQSGGIFLFLIVSVLQLSASKGL